MERSRRRLLARGRRTQLRTSGRRAVKVAQDASPRSYTKRGDIADPIRENTVTSKSASILPLTGLAAILLSASLAAGCASEEISSTQRPIR